jgi:hypothetical protein
MKSSPVSFLFGLLALLPISAAAQNTAARHADLIQSLDLTRPDLALVKDALEKQDLPEAEHAFADHLRTRTAIHWHFEPSSPPKPLAAAEKQEADDALKHTFTNVGITYTFPRGSDIDWKFNPTALPDSKRALNHEWTWQFNRMHCWPALAHLRPSRR